MRIRLATRLAIGTFACAVWAGPALAQKKYDPGVTDTEIKIGQTVPYSAPASAYGAQGKAEIAFWKMLNERGGINGRKVNLLSFDDGYSPPKTVEQTRKLVEEENIFANVGSLGTPTNTAIQKYLHAKKVPHVFISTGASKWNEPKSFPLTVPLWPLYVQEGRVYGKVIAQTTPNAKVAVLYQNDDFGKDYLRGLKEGLGDKASLIVKEATFEITDPTIDSQVIALHQSGADTFINISTPKVAAQAIRRIANLGWKPKHYLMSVASSIGGVLEPAGLDNSVGLITALTLKVVGDPTWDDDPEMKAFLAFMKQYLPDGNPLDGGNVAGYVSCLLTAELFQRMGDTMTRENLMKQLTSMRDVRVPMMLPGMSVTFTPDDYAGYRQFRLARFDGKKWALYGENVSLGDK